MPNSRGVSSYFEAKRGRTWILCSWLICERILFFLSGVNSLSFLSEFLKESFRICFPLPFFFGFRVFFGAILWILSHWMGKCRTVLRGWTRVFCSLWEPLVWRFFFPSSLLFFKPKKEKKGKKTVWRQQVALLLRTGVAFVGLCFFSDEMLMLNWLMIPLMRVRASRTQEKTKVVLAIRTGSCYPLFVAQCGWSRSRTELPEKRKFCGKKCPAPSDKVFSDPPWSFRRFWGVAEKGLVKCSVCLHKQRKLFFFLCTFDTLFQTECVSFRATKIAGSRKRKASLNRKAWSLCAKLLFLLFPWLRSKPYAEARSRGKEQRDSQKCFTSKLFSPSLNQGRRMVEDDENGGCYSQVISREKQSFRHLWKRSHWWAMNTDMPRVPHQKSENKRGQTLFFSNFWVSKWNRQFGPKRSFRTFFFLGRWRHHKKKERNERIKWFVFDLVLYISLLSLSLSIIYLCGHDLFN